MHAARLAADARTPADAAVPEHLADIWRAFNRLSRDRAVVPVVIAGPGGAITQLLQGPITFAALDAYARRYGYAGHDFDDLSRLIFEMDEEWLAVMAELRAEG